MKHRRLVVAGSGGHVRYVRSDPGSGRSRSITGYPDQITKVDLDGYVLQTSYPLGNNAGNTFEQTYEPNGQVFGRMWSGAVRPCTAPPTTSPCQLVPSN